MLIIKSCCYLGGFMGIFDGFVICSDLDGTFWGQGAEVENQKAVEYFTENGGRFSFATGRTVEFMRLKPFFSVINAPTCLFNGAVVYDYAEERLLRETRLPYTVRDFLEAVSDKMDVFRLFILYRNIHDSGTQYTSLEDITEDDLKLHSIKLLCCFETPERTLEFRNDCLQMPFFKDTFISRSWSCGVEFNAVNGTKGDALDFIKGYCNAHTSIGIGDYDNDLTLVQRADIGVAVENAVDELKACADWRVVHYSKSAIKDLISRLETAIKKGELNE